MEGIITLFYRKETEVSDDLSRATELTHGKARSKTLIIQEGNCIMVKNATNRVELHLSPSPQSSTVLAPCE